MERASSLVFVEYAPMNFWYDFIYVVMISISKKFNFYSSDLHKKWKLFFDDPETFISAILASWAKIRVPPGYHFWSWIFKKIPNGGMHHPT